jgi:REP element-mobilizing transposase RayT
MAQSFSRLWTHLIFSTKNRFPFLSDKVLRAEMHAYLAEMLRKNNCETLIVGGVEDHAHALFALSRTLPIASNVSKGHHQAGLKKLRESFRNSTGKAVMPRSQ